MRKVVYTTVKTSEHTAERTPALLLNRVSGMYLSICWSRTSSCTHPLCQSGSGCHCSRRTRTGRRHWLACHSTSGYYSPDMCPGPKPSHIEGLVVRSLLENMSQDGEKKGRIKKNTSTSSPPLMVLIPLLSVC